MKRAYAFLKTPHPIGFGWKYVLIPGIIVFLILFILQPFSFDQMDTGARFMKSLAFGTITTAASAINLQTGRFLLPRLFDEDRWTIGFELVFELYDILLIGFWNSLFLFLAYPVNQPFLELLFRIEYNTLIIGIIPAVALVSIKNHESLKSQLKNIKALNKQLSTGETTSSADRQISLVAENGKLAMQLLPSEIVYLKSEGNYVDVFTVNDQHNVSKHLLRNRLKNVLILLPNNTFFQCHKSYIINRSKIIKVDGNARNLKLHLRNSDEPIPVSRGKSQELLSFIQSYQP
ncbi:MAG: LytTR family DNA-binding domain-containing protein [Bacteroidota bacterium]